MGLVALRIITCLCMDRVFSMFPMQCNKVRELLSIALPWPHIFCPKRTPNKYTEFIYHVG